MREDTISRQAAIDAVNDCGICIQKIVDLPTADVVERKRGKWIEAKPMSGRIGKVCSACGNEAYWDSEYGQQLFDWCPYCGSYNGEESDNG